MKASAGGARAAGVAVSPRTLPKTKHKAAFDDGTPPLVGRDLAVQDKAGIGIQPRGGIEARQRPEIHFRHADPPRLVHRLGQPSPADPLAAQGRSRMNQRRWALAGSSLQSSAMDPTTRPSATAQRNRSRAGRSAAGNSPDRARPSPRRRRRSRASRHRCEHAARRCRRSRRGSSWWVTMSMAPCCGAARRARGGRGKRCKPLLFLLCSCLVFDMAAARPASAAIPAPGSRRPGPRAEAARHDRSRYRHAAPAPYPNAAPGPWRGFVGAAPAGGTVGAPPPRGPGMCPKPTASPRPGHLSETDSFRRARTLRQKIPRLPTSAHASPGRIPPPPGTPHPAHLSETDTSAAPDPFPEKSHPLPGSPTLTREKSHPRPAPSHANPAHGPPAPATLSPRP